MSDSKKVKHRDTRRNMTIDISPGVDDDMILYLAQRQQWTGVKMTKKQFIETAIMRELARVRGKNPEEVPDAPNFYELGQRKRKLKNA
jgi:hypothetical protein